MKRPPDDDGRYKSHRSSSDSRIEELVGRFFRRHPRFFLYAGIGLGALIVIALVVGRFSGSNH